MGFFKDEPKVKFRSTEPIATCWALKEDVDFSGSLSDLVLGFEPLVMEDTEVSPICALTQRYPTGIVLCPFRLEPLEPWAARISSLCGEEAGRACHTTDERSQRPGEAEHPG